jgi:hypothetical protein
VTVEQCSGAKVTTGFLTGNLFSKIAKEKLEKIDIDASVDHFARLLKNTLQAEYPGAEIEILYEPGEGPLPYHLRTHVRFSPTTDWAETDYSAEYINALHDDICREYQWIIHR